MNRWCHSCPGRIDGWKWTFSWFAVSMIAFVGFVPIPQLHAAPARTHHSTPSNAPAQFHLSVADLGYTSDPVMQGTLSELVFAFPLPEGGISAGQLALDLQASPILNPQSTLQIALNERPVTSLTVAQLQKQGPLTIPVDEITEPFLTVRVTGHLFISDDTCVDERGGAMWTALDRRSSLTATPRVQSTTIRDFLQQPGGRVLMHGVWDSQTNQAASIALFGAINYAYRHSTTQVALAEDAATLAKVDSTEMPIRDVFLAASNEAPPLRMQDNALYVRADQPALDALVTAAQAAPLLLGQTVHKLETVPTPTTVKATTSNAISLPASHRLSLIDLDVGNQNISGSGDETSSVRFTLADLGGWPSDLNVVLDNAFDPVPTNTLERAFVRVYLNGTLLDTVDIRGQSQLQRTIALPTELLQADNTLQTTWSYASSSGNCQGAPYRFTGQTRSSSYLSWSRYDNPRGVFPEVIGMLHGEGQLVLLDKRPEIAQAAARLVGGLSNHGAQAFSLQLRDANALTTLPTSGYRIVVGGDSATAKLLKLPLNIGQSLQVVDPQTTGVVLSGTPDQSLATVEYLPGAVPTLALQASPGADSQLLPTTITQMMAPQAFFRLNGNTIVGNGTQIIALDLAGSTFKVRQPDVRAWTDELARYIWVIFVVLATLIIGLWMFVYQRVGRKQQPPRTEG